MPQSSETSRQLVHIASAAFAILLRYTTWQQAAGLMATALLFNLFGLARVAPAIVRANDATAGRAGTLFYPLSLLVLVLVFPARLDIVAAAWGVMAFGDGAATLAGVTLGGPRLPWNPRKTWSGLAAFVVCGGLGAVAFSAWVAPAVVPMPAFTFTIAAPLVAALVAALVETLPIELDDNLTVPVVSAGVLWYLAQFNPSTPADSLLLDLIVGTGLGLPIAVVAVRTGRLTTGGAAIGLIFAGVIYAGTYLAGLLVLAVALAVTILSSRAGLATKLALGIAEERHGRRAAGNVIANCLVGTLGAALAIWAADWRPDVTATWLVAAIAAGASDTVASEIGKAWGGPPRAFPSFRRVSPGTPGAVSGVGTLAGLATSALIALPAAALWLIPWPALAAVVVGCACGAFVESTLATLMEEDGILDNNTLNFVNTAVAAVVATTWAARVAA